MNSLRLLRYVRSFLDGRVRIRHPALQDREVVEIVRKHLSAVRGVRSLQFNPDSGSVLILGTAQREAHRRGDSLGCVSR